nr:hypothetical protein [uncultured Neokomagataea sp.]
MRVSWSLSHPATTAGMLDSKAMGLNDVVPQRDIEGFALGIAPCADEAETHGLLSQGKTILTTRGVGVAPDSGPVLLRNFGRRTEATLDFITSGNTIMDGAIDLRCREVFHGSITSGCTGGETRKHE